MAATIFRRQCKTLRPLPPPLGCVQHFADIKHASAACSTTSRASYLTMALRQRRSRWPVLRPPAFDDVNKRMDHVPPIVPARCMMHDHRTKMSRTRRRMYAFMTTSEHAYQHTIHVTKRCSTARATQRGADKNATAGTGHVEIRADRSRLTHPSTWGQSSK